MKIKLPKIIRKDAPRKAVALFFAVLIWFVVSNQLHDFATFHDVPVTLQYPPDKLVLERRVLTATVTLRGPRRRLESLQSSDITITAEIPPVPEGVYSYDLHFSQENIQEPPGTNVTAITPETARIQLDRIVNKDVPVRVRESGELGYGYRIVERAVVPSRVTVTGPSKVLPDIDEVMTEAIVLDETLVQNFKVDKVDIIPIPRVSMSPETVHVSYDITRHSGQKALMELSIHVLRGENGALHLANELQKASVTVRGPRVSLDGLKPHSVRPFVDISTITSPGRYTVPVNVWVEGPSKLAVEYVHPPEVDVVLKSAEQPPAPAPETPEPEENAEPEPTQPETEAVETPVNGEE